MQIKHNQDMQYLLKFMDKIVLDDGSERLGDLC